MGLGIATRLGEWLGRLTLRLYPRVVVDGITVILGDLAKPKDATTDRLRAVFSLLNEKDARRYKWLYRYVDHLVLWTGHYSFADNYRGVFVSCEYLLEASLEEVAGVLVHEACHHRIKRFGIRTNDGNRERIEVACVREQSSFLRSLGPRGQELASEVEEGLLRQWWSYDYQTARIEELVERGMPRWTAWLMKRRIGSAPTHGQS